MNQPTAYRVEFGPAWPVPPITVDFADPNQFHRAVAAHAIPHLKPRLEELGRTEAADCFFRTDKEMTVGEFWWVDLASGKGARFCPARLTPTDLDPDICGDTNDDEVCELERGHSGDHQNGYATVGWPNAFAAAVPAVSTTTKDGEQ
jgi:hypothetical protein